MDSTIVRTAPVSDAPLDTPGYRVYEALGRTSTHATWRARRGHDSRPVVLKLPLAPQPTPLDIARLHHEVEISQALPADAVVRALGVECWDDERHALVLEDIGGESMASKIAPQMPLRSVLRLGCGLAEALAAVHAAGVIHKDIKPANVIVVDGQKVRLTDFGFAVRIARESARELAPRELEGTLAYMAPEQTGRMNRPIDRRSDLYALGTTLYELATGLLPFRSQDPLDLVHQHIARIPPSPREHRPELPRVLADLILKLMAKDAEARYQSAAGVLADLRRCLDALDGDTVPPFAIGQHDAYDEFRIPQSLIGRAREVGELNDALSRSCAGAVQLVVVEGPSGIGKSVLVGEIARLASAARALQVGGKFDQFRRDLPYSAIIQAFGQVARRLLTEPDERLAAWRVKLVGALAPNGQVLLDLVPELAPVLGPQPPVLALGLSEARTRFTLVLRGFVRALASAEHPLVLFIDDLQWADGASLALLQTLLTDPETAHLLVVVAMRDSEVGSTHPFRLFLQDLAQGPGTPPVHVVLGPLDRPAVARLLAEATRARADAVAPLAELVTAKTGGNPFFVGEFLREISRDGLLQFDAQRREFLWDLEAVRQRHTTDNVVDLVIKRISRLPAPTREVLEFAAVVGHSFNLATLAQVAGRGTQQTRADLAAALENDILVPVGDDYKYTALADDSQRAGQIGYAFLHDRVQQAVYGMLPIDRRPGAHHRVGRLLLASTPGQVAERLFDIAAHFEAAGEEVRDAQERTGIAALFLQAAQKANGSMAWDAGRRFAEAGRALLGPQGWQAGDTMQALSFEALKAAFLLSDRAGLEAVHDEIVRHARSDLERANATAVKIQLLVSAMAYSEALDVAVPLLGTLGVRLPRKGRQAQVVAGLVRTKWALRGRPVAGLAELPAVRDPTTQMAMRVLVTAGSAAYFSEPQLFPQMVFELVRRSIRDGTTPQSSFGYVCYGLAMCAVLGDYDGGLAFGRLALTVMDRTGARDFEAKVRFLGGLFILPWSHPLQDTLEPFRLGAAAGLETGDLEYYSYCFYGLDSHALFAGQELAALSLACAAHHEAILLHNQQKVGVVMLLVRDTVAWLRDDPPVMVGDIDEDQVLQLATERGDATSIAYAHAWRCCRAYLGDAHDDALRAAAACRANVAGIDGQLFVPFFQFYESLALLAVARSGNARPGGARTIAANQRRMAAWAKRVPSTFLARWELVEAERARGAGTLAKALAGYERAVAAATSAGNPQDQAMAHQLAAGCAADAGMATAARGHRLQARRAWDRWGARRLVRQLDEQGRESLPPMTAGPDSTSSATTTGSHSSSHSSTGSGSGTGEALDARAITRAAQAVSEKLRLPEVVRELCSLLLANAGARQVVLIARDEQDWRVLAMAHVDRPEADALVGGALGQAEVFQAAVQLVLRTQRPLLLDDALQDATFHLDRYVARARPRSVLCSPMLRHGELVGAILLENELVAGAFTPDRVEFLQVIASQAAISIENAGLVQELERSLDAQVELTNAHARFVPHQFLASLGRRNIQDVRLGDHASKSLSVLFSDIRGFTPLIGSLTPRASIDFINAYIGRMEPAILGNGGFVDSYIGDAIMALFDGPPDDAVAAGIGMLGALREFNTERSAAGQVPLSIGVGINTGALMLGTIGGPNRIKCGVIGDPVNLAARIEGLTKQLAVPLLVGDETVGGLTRPGAFLLRPVGRVVLVGRSEAVVVHEVFDADPPALRDAKAASLERYRQACAAFYSREWSEARAGFEAVLKACPDDSAARAYLQRCDVLLADPPGADWTGVLQMDRK
ncbi:AAA family ATPase [Variovorax sp. OV329]|uniref:AAA family ATPase n=1 Tax=Variovorax sp. OV329 TaxID=1882825 RepID=UPI0008EACCF1|nr:AAA family ATPase [Variovorax sp. OV329]SFN17685.1 Predicted ATPase [Variovorax sp. OV329]